MYSHTHVTVLPVAKVVALSVSDSLGMTQIMEMSQTCPSGTIYAMANSIVSRLMKPPSWIAPRHAAKIGFVVKSVGPYVVQAHAIMRQIAPCRRSRPKRSYAMPMGMLNVIDPIALMCEEPPPPAGACDDLNCGDPCRLDRPVAQPGDMEGNLQPAPDGVCNPERVCVPVQDAPDPVCQPDPACQNSTCGDVCFPEDPGADPAPPGEGEGAPAPPPFRCNYEGRCADEGSELFCE